MEWAISLPPPISHEEVKTQGNPMESKHLLLVRTRVVDDGLCHDLAPQRFKGMVVRRPPQLCRPYECTANITFQGKLMKVTMGIKNTINYITIFCNTWHNMKQTHNGAPCCLFACIAITMWMHCITNLLYSAKPNNNVANSSSDRLWTWMCNDQIHVLKLEHTFMYHMQSRCNLSSMVSYPQINLGFSLLSRLFFLVK